MGVVNLRDYPQVGEKIPKGSGAVASRMESRLVFREEFKSWKLPPFQRELKVNKKLQDISDLMACDGIIKGVITLGKLNGETYLVDGQHRREAFLRTELPECYMDVRECLFDSMEEMAEEFTRLNSSINMLRPDDLLRAMESSIPALSRIRKECPFVGYNYVSFALERSPILSMSGLLKSWHGSGGDMPTLRGGKNNKSVASGMSEDDLDNLIAFLKLAMAAWGRGKDVSRLWGRLNLTMCLWLYRQVVMERDDPTLRRERLTKEQFRKGMMGLGADARYGDWLQGRQSERDRQPAYNRVRDIFVKRLHEDFGKRIKFPNSSHWND